MKIIKGEIYYYAKDKKKMKCTDVGEILSRFIDYKKREYQFYNKDIYKTKYNSNN